MGAEGDGRISANIGAERKNRLKELAGLRFNGNMTAALVAAVDAIPPHIKEAIDYIRLIMHTGTPAQDWNIIKQEVDKLWKSTQL